MNLFKLKLDKDLKILVLLQTNFCFMFYVYEVPVPGILNVILGTLPKENISTKILKINFY